VGNVETNPPSHTWTVDLTPPMVSIGAPSATVVTLGESVSFAITYGDAIAITLAGANVQLNSIGTAVASAVVSGSGASSRTVTITNLGGEGNLGISLAAGTARDLAGNAAPAAGPSATFQVVQPPPTTLQIQELSQGIFVITFNGLSNRTYRIQYAAPLASPSNTIWQMLGTAAVNSQGIGTFTNMPAVESRFYRTVFP